MSKTNNKSKTASIICFGMAIVAAVLGVVEIVLSSTTDFEGYSKHCDQDSYTESEQTICHDVAQLTGATYNEVKIAEVITLFSTCAILVALGVSKKSS